MHPSPTLSIIVPCLNEAARIATALARLTPLRKRGAELIVVDGGSEDDSVERALPLANRVAKSKRGRAVQMNAGAALATAPALLFLHADCALPNYADSLILKGLAVTGAHWGRFDVSLEGSHPLLPVIAGMMNLRSRATAIATGDQGIFVTRDLFAAVGGFPEIPLMEDIALCRRLKSRGAPLCLPQRLTTSARRWEQRGVLRTILLMWWLRLEYYCGADPSRLAARYDVVRERG